VLKILNEAKVQDFVKIKFTRNQPKLSKTEESIEN